MNLPALPAFPSPAWETASKKVSGTQVSDEETFFKLKYISPLINVHCRKKKTPVKCSKIKQQAHQINTIDIWSSFRNCTFFVYVCVHIM